MPKVSGQRVLIFGDSLSADEHAPGAVLAKHLINAGAMVRVDAKVGRSAPNFYTTREDAAAHVADALAFAPHTVIVVLGTNDIGRSPALDLAAFLRLRRELGAKGATFWAFGPPTFPASGKGSENNVGRAAVIGTMRQAFGDHFLDLGPLSRDLGPAGEAGRAADGVHFTAAGGQVLGARMADRFLAAGGGAGALLIAVALATAAAILLR